MGYLLVQQIFGLTDQLGALALVQFSIDLIEERIKVRVWDHVQGIATAIDAITGRARRQGLEGPVRSSGKRITS